MQGPLRSDVNYTPIICYGQRQHCSPRGANCDSLLLISFFQRMSTDRSTAARALFFYRYLLPETNNFCFTVPDAPPIPAPVRCRARGSTAETVCRRFLAIFLKRK